MLGVTLPSFMVMLLIAMYLTGFRENPWVNAAFEGMRPAVLALIVVPFVRYVSRMKWWGVALALFVAAFIWAVGVSPTYLILGAAAAGIVLTFWRKF